MAYRIGRAHKIGKQNIERLDTTTVPYSSPSTPSNNHKKLNKNNDITRKKSLTADTHSSTTFALDDKSADIIQTEPVSVPYTKKNHIYVDDYAQ